ncbi:MAG: restriction endonuclease subunit S [Bacteroidales bacterium]|nr:restriction endonuclease subunit S [Bacteroidales bacterium]
MEFDEYIRSDWSEVKLGEICEKAAKIKRKEVNPDEEFIYLDIGGIDNQSYRIVGYKKYHWKDAPSRAQQIVKVDDTLFSTVRTYLKNIAIVDNPMYENQVCSSGFTVLRAINGLADSKFLFAFSLFEGFLRPLNKLQTGTSYPAVRDKDVFGQIIPLPPIPEQRAIVSKIEQLFSDLDNGINNFKNAQEQLRIYRQAVLKKAFEGEFTKKWREEQTNLLSAKELLHQIIEEREKHYQKQLDEWKSALKYWEDNGKEGKKTTKPNKLKDVPQIENNEYQDFDILPDNWTWTRLASCVVDSQSNIVDGPFGSNLQSAEYVKEGKPVLMIQNIKANQFIDKRIKYVTEKKFNSLLRHQFTNGDLIVTKLGDPLGLCCRVPKRFNEGVIVADLIRIKPSSENINYDWLMYLINSQILQGQFRKITKGTTRPRMNLTIMRNVILPLCSKEEQSQIVQEIETRLSICDKMEATIAESLQKAEALRQSILKKAFEGKLLNETELEEARNAPDWEPAKKLLERIKAEKKISRVK